MRSVASSSTRSLSIGGAPRRAMRYCYIISLDVATPISPCVPPNFLRRRPILHSSRVRDPRSRLQWCRVPTSAIATDVGELLGALTRAQVPASARRGQLVVDGVGLDVDVRGLSVVSPAIARGLGR